MLCMLHSNLQKVDVITLNLNNLLLIFGGIYMYSMKETCEKTNLTYQTLKYYCNEGLIPNVKRNENNYRVFDDNDIAWIKSLSCLKNCGMSILEWNMFI